MAAVSPGFFLKHHQHGSTQTIFSCPQKRPPQAILQQLKLALRPLG
ncbi:hypothetical protein Celaphus_00019551 [Cervus elaphus hippelaphus]|uniref:Uncharacterized protein n=1 Tax=Cervus elaphus hippelaphus TaxID=46360 RepID=A0A212C361_CEREH|nr:hypothetical protein Celaphus_00019551 [Cervus elaphus hippelaphus]